MFSPISKNFGQSQQNTLSKYIQAFFKMLFRTTLFPAVALLLGINQAVGAALEPRSAEIATTACLCHPNPASSDNLLKFFLVQTTRATAPTTVRIRKAQVASTIVVLATPLLLSLVVSSTNSSAIRLQQSPNPIFSMRN